MNQPIKQELHERIENCDNELLLQEAKALLQSEPQVRDWWDELTEDDKNLLMESEEQYKKGDFILHNQLMQQFEEWKKK